MPCFAALANTLQVRDKPWNLQPWLADTHCTSRPRLQSSGALCSISVLFLGAPIRPAHGLCAHRWPSKEACWTLLQAAYVNQTCLHWLLLQELELQHTATVLDDAAGFLAVIGQLTALTSLAAGSNQLSDLPEAWQQLKQLKVRTAVFRLCF